MSNRGDRIRLEDLPMIPGNPLYDDLELIDWMACNPLPWPESTHRITISTSTASPNSWLWRQRPATDDPPFTLEWSVPDDD